MIEPMIKRTFSLGIAATLLASATWAASDKDIYSAIRSGEPLAAETLLREGVSPNQRDANGNTLLINAAMYGRAELLSFLIEKGADVNAANNGGATALMRAAGDTTKIKLLVNKGANVNARSALGNTPLILAARANPSAEAVKLLIERGADVNATNIFRATAIQTAAASGDLETVRILIRNGADVNAHSRGAEPAVLWGGGRSPLGWAAVRGDLAMIKLLINAGANVNEPEGFGTALIQAAWMDQIEAARLLIKNGADVNAKDFRSGYTALHWAASSDRNSSELVDLLLKSGANPNAEGGEQVDAFLGVPQTPLMLAKKRGDTPITQSLTAAHGKVNAMTEKPLARGGRELPNGVDPALIRIALKQSVPQLEDTAVQSKKSFVSHASKQDCVSCHQQYVPMIATSFARRAGVPLNETAENEILAMVKRDNVQRSEMTAEATFHPEPAHSYAYALVALAVQDQPADPEIDAIVHHLLVIQDKDGQWRNNLPRPPLQTSDVAPTSLAIKALTTYGFPAQQKEIDQRITRARNWLWKVHPANTEERAYQLLGLAWAGENPKNLQKLATAFLREQHPDGGWSQLAKLDTDAYATGSALFALHTAGIKSNSPEFRKGLEYLLKTQLDDGTWHVARRAFPFQPTMKSGFPHSRDSWISAAGTSWATIALSLGLENDPVQVSLSK
jgi:ankyrin repeat protein